MFCLTPILNLFSFERLIWMPENLSVFKEKLKEGNYVKHLDAAKRAIPLNINQAVSINNKVNVTKFYPRQTWFGKECEQEKSEFKRTLRTFRRSNSMEDRTRYVEPGKQYRILLTRKSDCYKTEIKKKLINSAKDPKTFWSTLKKYLLRKEWLEILIKKYC